ncbi:Two component regulator three Y domain-containing protein (plasmid) [Bacillus mycoides]|nr:accessory Sec system protein Asp2 [Bacillus mycoides]QWH09536.1 Two component regulator three Y domain-containing protein [Bacillus mycoides]
MLAYVKKMVSTTYMKRALSKEREFDSGECKLKYLFLKNNKSDKLLVVFSGFPAKGKPAVYNYVLKFRNVECNKLYILDDFGDDVRGSYYLGENNNFFVERAVTKLIDNISKENSIKQQDITTIGTSKGGFAALYFSLKNNYGAAIAGEPQVLLGDYLNVPHHIDIYNYIVGDSNENKTQKLNDLLFNLIGMAERFPKIYLHCGKNGYHYDNHLVPLVNKLEAKNVKLTLDLGDYEEHGDVGKYFPTFAFKSIDMEINKSTVRL